MAEQQATAHRNLQKRSMLKHMMVDVMITGNNPHNQDKSFHESYYRRLRYLGNWDSIEYLGYMLGNNLRLLATKKWFNFK